MLYEHILRPLLFSLSARDPEIAHEWALRVLRTAGAWPLPRNLLSMFTTVEDKRLSQPLFGYSFRNPVGLAAGFDKNAVALRGLVTLGFGFLEIGTVTSHPQVGNPRPRMVRLPRDRALINRMGFNNDGAAAVASRLAALTTEGTLGVPLGISIGKSKITPLAAAPEDYCASFRLLAPYASYVAVNVSSPNTPGLRHLQEREHLVAILCMLRGEIAASTSEHVRGHPLPLLVKIAPDLSEAAIDELLGVCTDENADGIIAVNTTVSRAGLGAPTDEPGGLSGRPLFRRAVEVVRFIYQRTRGALPIIGVGGIGDAQDAYTMLKAGASLLEVYTGFVYHGPFFVRAVNRGLLALMERDGVDDLAEIRGTA